MKVIKAIIIDQAFRFGVSITFLGKESNIECGNMEHKQGCRKQLINGKLFTSPN